LHSLRRFVLLAAVGVGAVSVAVMAAGPGNPTVPFISSAVQSSTPIESRRVHSVGDLWMAIGNDGTFGSGHGGYIADPREWESLGIKYTPSFEFPPGSRRDYLYMGSLWIGGIVDADTLVSVGHEGWAGSSDEFNGFERIDASVDTIRGQQDFWCRYQDTMIPYSTYDFTQHHPMGLEVTQTSHAWQSAPYNRFVIAEYTIHNISADTIFKSYIGLFADADAWTFGGPGGPHDDVSGYLARDGIAYTIDNDGDPMNRAWTNFSVRGAFGIAPLRLDPPAVCTTFNWWASDYYVVSSDWGPRLLRDTANLSLPWRGTPTSDRDKYRYMSNGEIDYDQLESAVDHSGQGWWPPPPEWSWSRPEFGADTRFVLAFGSYDLAPGDSVYIAVAFVAGDSVHQNPDDYARYFRPRDPQLYYDRLNFRDLVRNTHLARQLYASGFDLRGAPPTRVRCTPMADRTIKIQWTPAPFRPVRGYRVYRRPQGEPLWTLIDAPDTPVFTSIDYGPTSGTTYAYAVSAVDSSGYEGPKSRATAITIALPPVRPGLELWTTPAHVAVRWSVPPVETTFAPLVRLNLYRHVADDSQTVIVREFPLSGVTAPDSSQRQSTAPAIIAAGSLPKRGYDLPFLSFLDQDVEPGTEYHYWATFINALDLESAPSREQSVMPMAFDRPGIVILHTLGDLSGCIAPDSTRAFYWSWARDLGFDTLAFDLRQRPDIAYAGFSMQKLAHYQTTVIVMEDANPAYPYSPLYAWLEDYLSHGGLCVFVLRNYSGIDFGGIPSGVLGIHGAIRQDVVYLPPLLPPSQKPRLVAEFRGARSTMPGYPDLDGDSSRAAANSMLRYLLPKYGPFIGGGVVPGVGAYDSIASDAEVLYAYVAGYPDTSSLHGMPVAIKRESPAGRAIAFNFPLSVMDREPAWRALTMAVADLGGDTTPVAAPPLQPARTTGIIPWVFGSGTTPPDPAWDLNHDGKIDIRDVVLSINRTRR